MKEFVAGAPLLTFVNCQTKEQVKMSHIIDYNKFGDEIVLDYANICNEEYDKIILWMLNENFVKIELEFNSYIVGPDGSTVKQEIYKESYPVTMVYKPFVKSSSSQMTGTIEFKIKVRD